MFFNDKKTLQLKGKVPGVTTKVSVTNITAIAAVAASTAVTTAAVTFMVIPETFPFSWSVFFSLKNVKIAWQK